MDETILKSEVNFRTSRSSGSGGQHVNKVETRVELIFDVNGSKALSRSEKSYLYKNLKKRITKEGLLQISVQEKRSQWKNKELAMERFLNLVKKGVKAPKIRKIKKIKPDRKKRLEAKKRNSEKKAFRRKVKGFSGIVP